MPSSPSHRTASLKEASWASGISEKPVGRNCYHKHPSQHSLKCCNTDYGHRSANLNFSSFDFSPHLQPAACSLQSILACYVKYVIAYRNWPKPGHYLKILLRFQVAVSEQYRERRTFVVNFDSDEKKENMGNIKRQSTRGARFFLFV